MYSSCNAVGASAPNKKKKKKLSVRRLLNTSQEELNEITKKKYRMNELRLHRIQYAQPTL